MHPLGHSEKGTFMQQRTTHRPETSRAHLLRQTCSRLTTYVVSLLLLFSVIGLSGCSDGSDSDNERMAEVTDLENRVFTFSDGTVFHSGLANTSVTFTIGSFNGTSTAPFRLSTDGATATGRATIGSCDFMFTASTFASTTGPQVGNSLSADCNIALDSDMLRVAANGRDVTATTSAVVQATLAGVVYIESNIPQPNGNSILAWRRDADGRLTPLPGSPFVTGGAGVGTDPNTIPTVGPFDSDQNLIVNAARSRLFAVNSGSDTIAVFAILPDGGLVPVAGSPFPSGGINPVSVGLAGDRLYVVNKNDDPMRTDMAARPNYTGFTVAANGALTPIPGSTVVLPSRTQNPTQALISPDSALLFGADLFGTEAELEPGLLQSFRIQGDGTLVQNTPVSPPAAEFVGGVDLNGDGTPDALPLGLQVHPTQRVLYVGFVTGNRLGVYTYNSEGVLTFVRSVPNGGALICWIAVNQAGTRLYTTNTGDDTISVYDTTDPLEPVEMQTVQLQGNGNPFQLALDSNGDFLYTVKQRAFPTGLGGEVTPPGEGSFLSVLRVNNDGTLSEVATSPLNLPVPTNPFTRAQGVAAL